MNPFNVDFMTQPKILVCCISSTMVNTWKISGKNKQKELMGYTSTISCWFGKGTGYYTGELETNMYWYLQ